MKRKKNPEEKGLLIGILLITLYVIIVLLAESLGLEADRTLRSGTGEIVGAFGIYYLGFLFILSYFYEHKCFLFRWLIWACEHTYPKEYGRRWALIFSGLSLVGGTVALLSGLGVIT